MLAAIVVKFERYRGKIKSIKCFTVSVFSFKKPTEEKTMAFMQILEKNRVNARLRRSRGKDIDAACGQLANKS